jgi:ubiquinone/menaquinone biosynthesis C-methylase UbiE
MIGKEKSKSMLPTLRFSCTNMWQVAIIINGLMSLLIFGTIQNFLRKGNMVGKYPALEVVEHQATNLRKPSTIVSVCPPPCVWQHSWGASAGSAISWDHAYFGGLSLQFMMREGMEKKDKILEVAVGSMSATVKFVENLDPGNVYGIDISDAQLRYGYKKIFEKRQMTNEFPFDHLLATSSFEIPSHWGKFDYAWSLSLWSHLPYETIRLSLRKVAAVLKPGGSYYTTAFIVPPGWDVNKPHPLHSRLYKDNVFNTFVSNKDRDPFHYSIETMQNLADEVGVKLTHFTADEWGMPRMQHMLKFTKL